MCNEKWGKTLKLRSGVLKWALCALLLTLDACFFKGKWVDAGIFGQPPNVGRICEYRYWPYISPEPAGKRRVVGYGDTCSTPATESASPIRQYAQSYVNVTSTPTVTPTATTAPTPLPEQTATGQAATTVRDRLAGTYTYRDKNGITHVSEVSPRSKAQKPSSAKPHYGDEPNMFKGDQATSCNSCVFADDLYIAYHKNPIAADKEYKGRVLLVTGLVYSIQSEGLLAGTTIHLAVPGPVSGLPWPGIECIPSESQLSNLAQLLPGDIVSLGGECSGDPTGLGLVVLKSCIVVGYKRGNNPFTYLKPPPAPTQTPEGWLHRWSW